MNENEIRVGNWFYHNPSDWSYRNSDTNPSVGDFNGYRFQWDSSDWYALSECTLFLKSISPIPLTEELLLKCGAVNNNIELKNDEYIEVRIKDGIAALWADDGCTEGHCLHVPCKYLHQLQNLVFVLTNEELTINL